MTSTSLVVRTDLLRLAGWICANGVAALLVPLLMRHTPALVSATLFGLVLGLLQGAAVGRSWREVLAWMALTVGGLTIVLMLVIVPFFGALYSAVSDRWIVAAVISVPLGAGMGLAQALVFTMRDLPSRTIGLWTAANAIAGAVVGALSFTGPLAQGALQGAVADDIARAAYGITFGLLTAGPLTVILRETRAVES